MEGEDIEIFDENTGTEMERTLSNAFSTLAPPAAHVEADEEKSEAKINGVTATVQDADNAIRVSSFIEQNADVGVAIAARIIHMAGCCHIWVGVAGEEPAMGGLAVAVQTPRDVDPSVTVLEGDSSESAGLASRLARRSGQMIYASVCLPSSALESLPIVERRIVTLLT